MEQKNYNGQDGFHNQGQRQNSEQALVQTPASRGVSFVIRKAEKLTTALYMVTDIMSEKDPMKWKVREIGVDILSDITLSANASSSERMSVFRNVMCKIERVVSFLDIAQSAQMMSEMNASVLKKEYLALKDAIEGEWHHVYDDGKRLLSGTFFDEKESAPHTTHKESAPQPMHHEPTEVAPFPSVERGEAPVTTPVAPISSTPQFVAPKKEVAPTHIPVHFEKPITPPARIIVPMAPHRAQPSPEPVFERPRQLNVRDEGVGSSRARSDSDREYRRKIILALIKQKPSLTVKDIVKSIPQVSEKTIQRELLSMVGEGILNKRGERRWSTYSLIGE